MAVCLSGIAGQLNGLGVISYFATEVGKVLAAANLSWQPIFALLNVVYFFLHYMFASQTAHVGALYSAFLAMMLSAGGGTVEPILLACRMGHNYGSLFGSFT
jgi:divalent anion:Na+ symporter, DASS family